MKREPSTYTPVLTDPGSHSPGRIPRVPVTTTRRKARQSTTNGKQRASLSGQTRLSLLSLCSRDASQLAAVPQGPRSLHQIPPMLYEYGGEGGGGDGDGYSRTTEKEGSPSVETRGGRSLWRNSTLTLTWSQEHLLWEASIGRRVNS
ncbi:hypothetical protein NHX12_002806 [Muraenolepis orangiensis]|uniref:Uncharacterized protein n=1 Tax=Muraenolepis orangiensis TaxID=630683 RepID=A0A9Q0DXR6_9TELE|nr:hypothetical protein NHX12_002806 [Muraenolepis orangiensis]